MGLIARVLGIAVVGVALGWVFMMLPDWLLDDPRRHEGVPACREQSQPSPPGSDSMVTAPPARAAPVTGIPSTAPAPALNPTARVEPPASERPALNEPRRAVADEAAAGAGGPGLAREPEVAIDEAQPATPGEPGVDEDPDERMVWSLDTEGIKGAVQEATPDIADCYTAWLRAHPDLEGKATVKFVIGATGEGDDRQGQIEQVTLDESELGHGLMEGCILNVMAGLQFEAPDEPITVRYPFDLTGD